MCYVSVVTQSSYNTAEVAPAHASNRPFYHSDGNIIKSTLRQSKLNVGWVESELVPA